MFNRDFRYVLNGEQLVSDCETLSAVLNETLSAILNVNSIDDVSLLLNVSVFYDHYHENVNYKDLIVCIKRRVQRGLKSIRKHTDDDDQIFRLEVLVKSDVHSVPFELCRIDNLLFVSIQKLLHLTSTHDRLKLCHPFPGVLLQHR